MAQQVKELTTTNPDNLSLIPRIYKVKEKPTPASCYLTSMCEPWHTCMHTFTHIHTQK